MNATTALKWGLVGVTLYAIYKWLAPSCKPGCNPISTAICNISSGIANSIINWTTCSAISLNGNIVLPNGAQVSANSVQIGHDCQGNVYANYQGNTYQLSASNSCGNYAATPVS
jgi:hypothetical protein